MYNKELEDKVYMIKLAERFASYYGTRIHDAVRENKLETTLILIRDFTPIFILGFASYFDNVRIILTQNYDFENDILFNMKNTTNLKKVVTYIKALYYKAPELKEIIYNGYRLDENNMTFNMKNYNSNRIEIIPYKIGFDVNEYITKLEGFPALVIDARLFEAEVKENVRLKTQELRFYDKLTANKVPKLQEEEEKEEVDSEDDEEVPELSDNIIKINKVLERKKTIKDVDSVVISQRDSRSSSKSSIRNKK
jgi:hypothetical protein